MTQGRPNPAARLAQSRESISELTTGRLSVYLRCLLELECQGVTTVSSNELARRFHLNSAQIRKDLANFGEFGIRGVGYDVCALKRNLIDTLGLSRDRTMIIVGAGNLGMALVNANGFNSGGFRVVALFDDDPAKIGTLARSGAPVLSTTDVQSIVSKHEVEIGIIAVPASSAQKVYDILADCGIRAVLNFAPARIEEREGIKTRTVDLRINLETLSYFLRCSEAGGDLFP